MQIWTPSPDVRDEGDFDVRLNDHRPDRPFAVIELSEDSHTGLVVLSPEECDRLIKAATKAKDLLLTARHGEA